MASVWKALRLTEDGLAAQHDQEPSSLNQRLSGECPWNEVHGILIQILSYMHPDGFRIHNRTYPDLSPRLWHTVIALDQITYIMEGPSRFPEDHTNSTRSANRANLDKSWCKIYDSIHDRWHDIWLWIQYLVSRGIFSRDSPLDIPQKQLLFTVVLDFFRICFSRHTAGHLIQRDALINSLPMVCKLWYLQATNSNFSFLEMSSITVLYIGMGCQHETQCGEISTGSMHLVDQMSKWTGQSARKVIKAVLAELRHYREDLLDDACHLNHAVFILDRFYQTSLTRYIRDLLLAQNSLHLVTRVIVHCVSRPFLPKPHRVTGHVLYLCFRYIALNLDTTDGVLGVNRALRAGLLVALIKASLWLPEIRSLGFKLPYYLVFYIIGKYSIYISVLRLIVRQMKKIKRLGLERLIVKDDTLHQEWTKFVTLVLQRLDLAGPSMLRICDNKLVRLNFRIPIFLGPTLIRLVVLTLWQCNRVDVRYKFPTCAVCGEGCFCSKDCQTQVWNFGNHKERCKEIQSLNTGTRHPSRFMPFTPLISYCFPIRDSDHSRRKHRRAIRGGSPICPEDSST